MSLENKSKVYSLLDELKIEYTSYDHEPAFTMDICKEIEKVIHSPICKNLFLCNRQKTNFYLLLMPGDKAFKTKDLSAQINSARLSFGSDDDLKTYLDLTPGSCTIFGLMNDPELKVRLLIDEDLLKEEYFGCHPCINTSTISFKTSDLFEKVIPCLNHDFTIVKL